MIRLVICALALALAGCGGGGGGGSSSPPATPLPPHLIEYGYFSVGNDAQIATTAASVSFVFTRDDGTWSLPAYDAFRANATITELQQAKARGIPHAIVSIGWLTLTQQAGCTGSCYAPRPDAIPRLLAFKAQLDALGLTDMVIALYPADEPELRGLTDASLVPLLQSIKAAWAKPLAVIYGTSGPTPGLAAYDWISRDDYGSGTGVFKRLPQIRADQHWFLVPGGADPWREDPNPFVTLATGDPRIVAVVAFLYAPYEGGQGIGTNGMLTAYCAAGRQAIGKPGAC